MRNIAIVFFVSLLILSCKKNNNPVEPSPSKKFILIDSYMTYIDSSFYKNWSDGSWVKFSKMITINGASYTAIINNSGYEYYYNKFGYCGYKIPPSSTIIFDKPLASWSDTLFFDNPVNTSTTFYYNGHNYKYEHQDILMDTLTVSIPIGIFKKCLWIKSTDDVSILGAGGQTEYTESWTAPLYGEIKYINNDGIVLVITNEKVNGTSLGKTANNFSSLNIIKGMGILNYMGNN